MSRSTYLAPGCQSIQTTVLLRSRSLYDQVIVSSFNPATLIKLRWHDPDVPLGLLLGREVEFALAGQEPTQAGGQ